LALWMASPSPSPIAYNWPSAAYFLIVFGLATLLAAC
jgi:hypothetical protein